MNKYKYIDKAAVVEEIEWRKTICRRIANSDNENSDYYKGKAQAYQEMQDFLDTLEVKEMDLEKAIDDYIYTNNGRKRLALELDWKQCDITFKGNKLINFAKHFFELGLAVSNPTTAADRGMAEEIIINLKRLEKDYRIDLTKEMEWLRQITKKQE